MSDTSSRKTITIYTDGSCLGNPGPGGWGAVLISGGHYKEIYGGEKDTTNNRMEIMAAIEALKILKKPSIIHLHTDSKYLKNGVTEWMPKWKAKNWRTSTNKPVKNMDLWLDLEKELLRHEVVWSWVKAHVGNEHNEKADSLARKGAESC